MALMASEESLPVAMLSFAAKPAIGLFPTTLGAVSQADKRCHFGDWKHHCQDI